MKLFFALEAMPTEAEITTIKDGMQAVLDDLQNYRKSLTPSERKRYWKIGPRRLAYAETAKRLGQQYESIMPRTISGEQLLSFVSFYNHLLWLKSKNTELQELLTDTTMACGIDIMSLSKAVHDAIRIGNNLEPAYNEALRELDEFYNRAQTETETDTQGDTATDDTLSTGAQG